ncbi:MAG TPA: hypothetical protein VJY35_06110 [Candidatus Eisenbacteria bacterium]|nr:hypothetical protein [Candidatus Eisenbacteria bacterium]
MHARIFATASRRAALVLIALVALVGMGCGKKVVTQLIPNQAPQVRLTSAPVDTSNSYFYAYTMQWVGYDPDGRIDHFLFAIDPANPNIYDPRDTTWRTTARNESTFFFSADTLYGNPIDPRDPRAEAPHIMSIFAVDNEGKLSDRPATRAFLSFTQCPIVTITEPVPNSAFTPNVTPTVTIKWTGIDPDGQDTKPKRWVFRLFGQKNPDFPAIDDFISFALLKPDSLRRMYAPGDRANRPTADFFGWNTVGQDTTSFQYRNLNPGSSYLFVVTGFDEAGAYDPVFAPGRNMLKFSVTFAGTFGPVITMFNQYFFFQYDIGGYDPREARWFRLEVPADQRVTFNWFADPPQGADIRRYRWAMDLVDLSDETPRTNELTDWCHWSAWSRNTTSATVGPFVDEHGNYLTWCGQAEFHHFYIEAEDNNGLTSLGIIYFRPVQSTFEKDLLFVDDTRFRVDLRSSQNPNAPVDPPSGPWPSAAELDTFLFAKGGYPWKNYPIDPSTGVQYVSTPGIFNGYSYDTIGTRGISLDGTVPLSFLGRYKHVVWYTDEAGASYSNSPSDRSTPITALRLVSSPGRPVILSTYISQGFMNVGGNVWLSGGGAAFASLVTWNRTGTPVSQYTSRDLELVPGRMMYDFVHWREGVEMLPAVNARKFGLNSGGSAGVGTNRPGRHWPPNPPLPTPPTPPNYTLLPNTLDPKNPAIDPVPPQRNPDSFFYRGDYMAEYILRPTFIREDYNDDPDILEEFSTLDTLYLARGGSALTNAPVMTYYHGRDNQPLIFSGFNFWYWRRAQCIQLVDWVLHEVWGLQRDGNAPREPNAPVSSRQAAR